MKHFARKPALIFVCLAAASLGMAGNAHARRSAVDDAPAANNGKKHAAAKPVRGKRVQFLSGSGETEKERGSRLKRECKGRVNAGACAGYTD